MAQATVELRQLLNRTNFKLFDFDYSFDDKAFKAQLEQNIIDFYYDYEIGFETPDMFKRKFKARWNRIIPYYNKLYNTTLLDYNPLSNQSLTETLDQLATSNNTQTNNLTNTTNGGNDSTTTTTDSDYPQQPIAGGDYASGASVENVNSTINNTATNTGTVKNDATDNTNYTKTIEGITGITYPELIQKHRDVLLRINDKIIEELKPCFILVY